VRPTSVDLALTVDPEDPAFRGEVTFHLAVGAPTRFIWLHGTDLTITSATTSQAGVAGPARVVTAEGGFLGVALAAPLRPGEATLTMAFAGRHDDERSRGLYRVKEPDGHFYSYTFFETTDARRAFPCFDEPGFKVPWRLTLTAPKGSVAIANTPAIHQARTESGATTTTFDETPPLPSYLVAFVVGPFEVVDSGNVGQAKVPLRFIVPQGRAPELTWAREFTPRAVAGLESWFGVPYPFAKLDVAVVPRFWGTMEHPGIVAMGQPLALIQAHEMSQARKQSYANILIHELGHYWFGDLVTMAWWDETWLNEGLTTWVDGQVTHAVEPTWHYDRVVWGYRGSAMSADAQGAAQPMRKPITTATDLQASFDNSTTYHKGSAVMTMLERWLGADVVRRGIRRYLADRRWKNAQSEDLFAALSAEAGRDVTVVLKGFVDQPGVPEVAIDLTCEKGARPTVALRQERYRPLGQTYATDTLWTIPVCLRFPDGKKERTVCDLLDGRAATWTLPIDGCPSWIVPNDGASGYYHTRLSAPLLTGVVKRFGQLALVERRELAEDVYAQIAAGRLEIDQALALGLVAVKDRDLAVVRLGFGLLSIDIDALSPAQTAAYGRLMKKLSAPIAKRLGLRPRPGETVDEQRLRSAAWSALLYRARDPGAIREATRLARAWLTDRTAVAAEVAGMMVYAAAYFGDSALFDAYLAEADRTADREDRTALLTALGAFPEPALVDRALALLLDPARDVRETRSILFAAMRKESRERAWAFFKSHHEALLGRMRDDEKSGFISLPGAFCTRAMRAEAEAFLAPIAKTSDGGPQELAILLDGLDTCVAQRERQAPGIARFLARY
jgi:aminopeptidase N